MPPPDPAAQAYVAQPMPEAPVEAFAPVDYSVELRDVHFRYSAAQPLLFSGLTLTIAPRTWQLDGL